MKLQHKAWALVLVTVGLAASGAMLGARHFVAESFEKLEEQRAEREGERARRLLQQQLDSLGSVAKDYGWWTDAVAFVRGRKPRFMSENFEVSNMGYLRLSQVLVLDAQGRALASVGVQADELVPIPSSEVQRLQPLANAVLADPQGETTLQTYLVHGNSLELVSAVAIRLPAQTGQPPAGALLMVRRLDDIEVQRLSDALMVPVRLSMDLRHLPTADSHQLPLDAENDELHAVLRDHLGQPVAELVLTIDRQLQSVGRTLSLTGMALAGLAGLLAAVLLVPLLDRLVLKRLQRLFSDLQAVTESGLSLAGAEQVRVQGRDEIALLARGINQLLNRARQDADAQREAHERQEALQVQLMQSQKTEALGRLTGGIAHDFNNSLAAITGWVRLAAEDLEPEHPSGESLQQALKATRYADGLMRQLLAFGRQAAPKLRRLHWTSLIEETRQMVGAGLTRDCELVVDYRVDDDQVDADPTQLQQVLVNLLINAADAMQGKGRIELVLTALNLPLPPNEALPPGAVGLAPGRYLVLTVCDHGPGIPPALRDRVFEPFFTTKPKGRGTGLGLSVAQGILMRHHGGIGLDHPEQGARFHLYLPASPLDRVVQPITAPDGAMGQGRHLLFVDDDQLVRHAWSALLERKGWNVTRARDGEEAWSHFSQTGKTWDLVLTDQSMPRLDGVGLARRIQTTTNPPPVVLMSGHVDEVTAETQRELFAAVLRKPVDAADLDRVLKDVLVSGESVIAPL